MILVINPTAAGQIIQGGVEYNTDTARQELFNTQRQTIPANLLKSHIIDTNNIENSMLLLNGQSELKDRTLARFSDGSYGIIYKNDPLHAWYYNSDGILTHCEVKSSTAYPYKSYKYSTDNRLINMSLRVSEDETFIYSPDKKLIAHWLSGNCYNNEGKVIMTRKVFK